MTVPQKKPTVCGRTPARRAQLRPREARAKQQALLLPMNAAALLRVKAELGKLRHKGALTTYQFQLLEDQSETWGSHRRGFRLTGPGMGTALRWYERRAGVY